MSNCTLSTKTGLLTCFVMLGKNGDLIHMLPIFLAVYKRDGVKPVVMVEERFAGVLDGVSYVTPWAVPFKWPDGIAAAKAEAEKHFESVVVPQFWNIPGPQALGDSEDLNCTLAMWHTAGFDPASVAKVPVLFDRRSSEREEFLNKTTGHLGRPIILYNLEGSSCPFPLAAEVLQMLRLLKGNADFIGDKFGDAIHVRIIHAHGPAHITHRGLGLHGTKGNDLGHIIAPIFFSDIINDLAPPLVAKININIRHAFAPRIHKTLK